MTPSDGDLQALAERLGHALAARRWRVATAESCTGGWIAKVFTDVSGSSGWFGTGWVTYSDAAKHARLGVPERLVERHGAVSEPVVRAMADGARSRAGADLAVAVSGIAGPDGGTPDKPLGTVWFAFAAPDGVSAERCRFAGSREAVRRLSVAHALRGLLALAGVPEAEGPNGGARAGGEPNSGDRAGDDRTDDDPGGDAGAR